MGNKAVVSPVDVVRVIRRSGSLDTGKTGGQSGRSKSRPIDNLGDTTLEWFRERHGQLLRAAASFLPYCVKQAQELALDSNLIENGADSIGMSIEFSPSWSSLLDTEIGASSSSVERYIRTVFEPLIATINDYRGDIISLGPDAMAVVFTAMDDVTLHPKYNPSLPPHGTYGKADMGAVATAALRACACALELQMQMSRPHKATSQSDAVPNQAALPALSLAEGAPAPPAQEMHLTIGLGKGRSDVILIGETRFRCVVAANAAHEQAIAAASRVRVGEICVSPQVWTIAAEWAVEGRLLPDGGDFRVIIGLQSSKFTFPCVRHAAMKYDMRDHNPWISNDMRLFRRLVPERVVKNLLEKGLANMSDLRHVSVLLIAIPGVIGGSGGELIDMTLLEAMRKDILRVCAANEGYLKKVLLTPWGSEFFIVFGLPPRVHRDDALRATVTAMELEGSWCASPEGKPLFFVTSGLCYCGIVGSHRRQEYTIIGPTIEAATRLAHEKMCAREVATHSSSLFRRTFPQASESTTSGKALFKRGHSTWDLDRREIEAREHQEGVDRREMCVWVDEATQSRCQHVLQFHAPELTEGGEETIEVCADEEAEQEEETKPRMARLHERFRSPSYFPLGAAGVRRDATGSVEVAFPWQPTTTSISTMCRDPSMNSAYAATINTFEVAYANVQSSFVGGLGLYSELSSVCGPSRLLECSSWTPRQLVEEALKGCCFATTLPRGSCITSQSKSTAPMVAKVKSLTRRSPDKLSNCPSPRARGTVRPSANFGACTKRVLLVSGEDGSGRLELAEFVVKETTSRYGAVPIFLTYDFFCKNFFLQAFLRSAAAAFRFVDPKLPEDDLTLIESVILEGRDADVEKALMLLRKDPSFATPSTYTQSGPDSSMTISESITESRSQILASPRRRLGKLAAVLVRILMDIAPVIVVCSIETEKANTQAERDQEEADGTEREEEVNEKKFNISNPGHICGDFLDILLKHTSAEEHPTKCPLMVLVVASMTLEESPVLRALDGVDYIRVPQLPISTLLDYVQLLLDDSTIEVTQEAAEYIYAMTGGNPRYVRELLHLVRDQVDLGQESGEIVGGGDGGGESSGASPVKQLLSTTSFPSTASERPYISASSSRPSVVGRGRSEVNLMTSLANLDFKAAMSPENWTETRLVSDVVCKLNALSPLQVRVLEAASAFESPCSLRDLCATLCRRWEKQTRFDVLTVLSAATLLASSGWLQTSQELEDAKPTYRATPRYRATSPTKFVNGQGDRKISPKADESGSKTGSKISADFSEFALRFRVKNTLIRKVCEVYFDPRRRRVAKRQALIERALDKTLPGRMTELNRRRSMPHVPWYYQVEG